MKDERKRHAQKGKKPYLRPEVRQVQLKPEEAVLGGCKINGGGSGPGNLTTCNPLMIQCSVLGTS
jgi:hypothetical protein